MNWSRRRSSSSPPGTGGVAEGRGGSKVENEWGGELFDSSTTPSLRATPVPGGELILRLLQFGSIQRRAVTVVSPE